MARTWKKLAQQFKDDPAVDIAKVDYIVHVELKLKFQIHRYPALLLLNADGRIRPYDGARRLDALAAFVTNGSGVVVHFDVLLAWFGSRAHGQGDFEMKTGANVLQTWWPALFVFQNHWLNLKVTI